MKEEKTFEMGAASNNKSKKPWASIFTLSPCGIDVALVVVSAIFFSQVHPPPPPIEKKIEQTNQTLRCCLAKAAFDTLRISTNLGTNLGNSFRESPNGGLANGGLRHLSTIVHDCLRLSSFCDESSPWKWVQEGHKSAQL